LKKISLGSNQAHTVMHWDGLNYDATWTIMSLRLHRFPADRAVHICPEDR